MRSGNASQNYVKFCKSNSQPEISDRCLGESDRICSSQRSQCPKEMANQLSNVPFANTIFRTISTILDMLCNTPALDTIQLVGQIKEIYRTTPLLSLISVDQCENLLKKIDEIHLNKATRYGLRNLFVALCRQPWLVDLNLGSHGVCYYGQSGAEPTSYSSLRELLCQNDNYIRGDRDFVCW